MWWSRPGSSQTFNLSRKPNGLYRFRSRAEIVQLTGLDAAELPIDPILFFVSTLFVIGAGLLFLRL